MTRRNQKYQNGLSKRRMVRAVRRILERAGAFETEAANLGGQGRLLIDTQVMFSLLEYWAVDLRSALRRLAEAQPELRLYLADVVASECRGLTGKANRSAELRDLIYTGRNGARALLWPLAGEQACVGDHFSRLRAGLAAAGGAISKPSDLKDAQIAATAIAYDLCVVTANVGHFRALQRVDPKLRVLALAGDSIEQTLGARLLGALGLLFVSPERREGAQRSIEVVIADELASRAA